MSAKLITNIISVAAMALAIVFYIDFREDRRQMYADKLVKIMAEEEASAQKTRPVATPRPTVRKSASALSIPKDPRSGQYHYKGRVNSGYVDFLVDTGASAIALTLTDARKAGIKDRNLVYNVPISTAGGRILAARVTLDQVALGGIMLRDVEAFVIPKGLETSLLGMTWLGQLQEVKATPNALLLRL